MTLDTYSLKKKKKHAMEEYFKKTKLKKSNKCKNEIKYLLTWIHPSMEEYFQNQRNFHLFWDLKCFTYKKEVLKAKASITSLT